MAVERAGDLVAAGKVVATVPPAMDRGSIDRRRRLVLRRAASGLGAATFLLLSSPASSQYLGAYKAGLEAIEAKDWELAASSLEKAIAERSAEKTKLPVRFFLRPYVPHFYLGYARFEVGDCAGALEAWAESERQGVLRKLPEAEVARRGREECDQRALERVLSQARQVAEEALSGASATASALLERSRAEPTRGLWAKGDPSPAMRHQRGLDTLRQAREMLAAADLDRSQILRAEALVRDALALFGAIEADVDRLSEARHAELADKDRGVETRVDEARKALERTSYLAPYPRLVRKARADLEGLIAEAQRRDAASLDHLDGLAARLENSTEALGRLAAAPPATLAAAAEAHLAGRHGEVIAALASARFGERRAQAHARLLLASSRLALYLEGGELDEELAAAAADDVRACREDDGRLTPTERFFSPRFIAFFDQSLAASGF